MIAKPSEYTIALAFLCDPERVTLAKGVTDDQIEALARKYAAGWRASASPWHREARRYPRGRP